LFSYQVNLEKRVRPEHPLRRVAQAVDFNFVRAAVASLYGKNGREPVDRAILLKRMFLLFYDNMASERELMQVIPERLDHLWFLGYGLNDEIPHPGVLSKARRRWGKDLFERLFVRTIEQCMAAGLVGGDKLHVDGRLLLEGSFADAANNHGFKRARWRRLLRQQIQDYLTAAIQNIRILRARTVLRPAASQVIDQKKQMRGSVGLGRQRIGLGTYRKTFWKLDRGRFQIFSLN